MKQEFKKKLVLKKQTVTDLGQVELKEVKGGTIRTMQTCTICEFCPSDGPSYCTCTGVYCYCV